MAEEVRTTNEVTGGQKGVKLERFDLIPVRPLIAVARLYGFGAQKYESRNWERGYEWSKSYGALQRHSNAFWGGEDLIQQNEAGDDPTAGMPHMAAVAWHAFALLEFPFTHPELDDRPKGGPVKAFLVDGVACDARTARRLLREGGMNATVYGIPPEGAA